MSVTNNTGQSPVKIIDPDDHKALEGRNQFDMITQSEADTLIAMKKYFIDQKTITLSPGTDETRELLGDDKQERFLLDLWRGTIRLSKYRYQTRARKIIILVRLCVDGSPHTNPDGNKIDGTHLHIYKEGYEDKWAYPIDSSNFRNVSDMKKTFDDFCQFCNIDNIPPFQEVLI